MSALREIFAEPVEGPGVLGDTLLENCRLQNAECRLEEEAADVPADEGWLVKHMASCGLVWDAKSAEMARDSSDRERAEILACVVSYHSGKLV